MRASKRTFMDPELHNRPSHHWSSLSRHTLLPTIIDSPSGCHTSVNASPRPLISLTQVLALTSQTFRTPSLLKEHNSVSLTGLKATFSIGDSWPLSSVEYRIFGRSGFHTRSVLSVAPVAIRVPNGFQSMVRNLYRISLRTLSVYTWI